MFWWRTTPEAASRYFPCLRTGDWARLQPSCSTPATARIRSVRKGRTRTRSILSPDDRFAIVDDLGLDETLVYKFDNDQRFALLRTIRNIAKADPGAGPRHFAFHPNGKFGYVVNEMRSTVSVFSYDGPAGAMHPLQTISTIPKDFTEHNEDC